MLERLKTLQIELATRQSQASGEYQAFFGDRARMVGNWIGDLEQGWPIDTDYASTCAAEFEKMCGLVPSASTDAVDPLKQRASGGAAEGTRDLVYARRVPTQDAEPLDVAREGNGDWHARDRNGDLVAVHQYRNDLIPGLTSEGFAPAVAGLTFEEMTSEEQLSFARKPAPGIDPLAPQEIAHVTALRMADTDEDAFHAAFTCLRGDLAVRTAKVAAAYLGRELDAGEDAPGAIETRFYDRLRAQAHFNGQSNSGGKGAAR